MWKRRRVHKLFKVPKGLKELFPTKKDFKDSAGAIAQGSVLGFFIGALPGAGSTVASFISYTRGQALLPASRGVRQGSDRRGRCARGRQQLGDRGRLRAAVDPRYPGSATTAIMLGALFLYGLQPGPLFFTENPDVVWPIIASMYIGNVMLVMLNMPLVPVFASILRIPYYVMYPAIVVISFVGVYSINGSMFDVGLLVISGLLGYVMRKVGLPSAPLVLAFVLGPLFEQAVRRSMVISQGDPEIFLTSPWSVVFLVVTRMMISGPLLIRDAQAQADAERGRRGPSER